MKNALTLANQPSIDNIERGASTAMPKNLTHRLDRLDEWHVIGGHWLDCGCADGGYTVGLLERGASQAIGVDVEANRLAQARRRPACGRAGFAGA
ncbi:MAG TPA: class I SAM-dependent methyltransferase, partial [Roseiflexaceae bacterium]|nr:class I SAM-dependent methyltransferase [Roseiflexaceae bacterium]